MNTGFVRPAIAIVPTACGIETLRPIWCLKAVHIIAIVPTACGIETLNKAQKLIDEKVALQ